LAQVETTKLCLRIWDIVIDCIGWIDLSGRNNSAGFDDPLAQRLLALVKLAHIAIAAPSEIAP